MGRCLFFLFFSQSILLAQTNWTKSRVSMQAGFIENVNQYSKVDKNLDADYYYHCGPYNILFSSNSLKLIYYTNKKDCAPSKEDEENYNLAEQRKEYNRKCRVRHEYIIEFTGSNKNIKIKPDNELPVNFRYVLNYKYEKARIFKQLTYTEIYPGIDLVFSIDSNAQTIHYGFNLKESAHVNDIQLKLSDNINVKENEIILPGINKENIVLTGGLGQLSQPTERSIHSQTQNMQGWIQFPLYSLEPVKVFDVDFDYDGDVYMYGMCHIFNSAEKTYQRYDSTGVLKEIGLFGFDQDGTYSDMLIDRKTKYKYFTEVLSSTGGNLLRFDDSGNFPKRYKFASKMNEPWRIAMDPCFSKLIVAGGGTGGTGGMAYIDTSLTDINAVSVFNTTLCCHDNYMVAMNNKSECFVLNVRPEMPTPASENQLTKYNVPGFLPFVYRQPSGYKINELTSLWFYHVSNNGTQGSGPDYGAFGGYNGIAVNDTNLYTYDGYVVKKWRTSDGALLKYKRISYPNNGDSSKVYWGGIEVDDCDNLLVANKNKIHYYDKNFNLVTSITLQDTIYDIKLNNKDRNKLYVGGRYFLQSLGVNFLPGCKTTFLNNTLAVTNVNCSNPGTATINIIGSSPPYNVLVSTSPPQSNTLITNLTQGVYSYSVSDNACLQNKISGTFTINQIGHDSLSLSSMYCEIDEKTYVKVNSNTALNLTWFKDSTIIGSGDSIQVNTSDLGFITAGWLYNSCWYKANTLQTIIEPEKGPQFINHINIFTPNGDGVNDFFNPVKKSTENYIEHYELNIFDRWGNNVFNTQNKTINWDGKGSSSGTYFWIVNFEASGCVRNKEKESAKGWVTLLK